MTFIDTNFWMGNWPFASIPENTGIENRRRLKRIGVAGAWVSSLDSVFQVDPMAGNRSVLEAIRNSRSILPLPVLNPGTPPWEDHLAALLQEPKVAVIRLMPAYHGYSLGSSSVRALVEKAVRARLRIVITARLVDERHEHRAISIKPVTVKALAGFIEEFPKLDPLIQGLNRHELEALAESNSAFLTDTSFAEWEDTLAVLKRFIPTRRILFGSLAPLQSLQAQVDKVRLSSLPALQREMVASGNARKFL